LIVRSPIPSKFASLCIMRVSALFFAAAVADDVSEKRHLVVGYAECDEGEEVKDYKFRYAVCPPTEESLDVICSFDTLDNDLYAHVRPREIVTGYLDLRLWGKEHNTTVHCKMADLTSAITGSVFRLLPGGSCPPQDPCTGDATTTTTTTTVPTTTVEETTPAPLVEGQLVVEQTCSEGGARAPGSYRVQVCPSLNVNVTRVSCNGQEVTIPAGEAVELTGTFAEGESVVCTAPYPLVSAGQLVWSSSGPCEGGCPAPGAVASVAAGDVVTPEESGTSTEVIMGVVGAGIALVFCLAVALLLICSARNAKRYVKKEEKMRKAMSEEAEKNAAEMKKAESMEAGFTDPNMVRIAGC